MNNMKLNLKISVQNSKLNKLTLFEKPDVVALDKLINSDLLNETFHCKITGKTYTNEKQQLIAYRNLINKETGLVAVKYEKSKGSKYGRVFPARSLGAVGIRRELRGTLFNNNMIDIDIENCHPELSNQICQANGIQNKYLNKYVTQRPELLLDIQNTYNVDRDSAKTLFIMLLYFGSFDRWAKDRNIVGESNKFVDKFKKELSLIGDHIVKENDELKKVISKIKVDSSEHQIKSSTVSYYFQEIENQILECIYEYCISKKHITKCCSLCYDGLMIEKENYKIELLDELNVLIKNKFGFDLKFTEKKMTHYLDTLDDHIITTDEIVVESVVEPTNDEYQNKKLDFELTNFKVLNPLMYVKIFSAENLAMYNKTDFCNVYENLRLKTNTEGKTKAFTNEWLQDETARTYKHIDFLPQQIAPKDVFNTFKGYEASKKELVDVDIENSLIVKHLKNLCGNDDAVFQYVLKTLAIKIQKPYQLTNTALIFKSKEGAGKDLFFNYFGNKILGSDYYCNTDKPDLLFGKFNSDIENKILIILNETSGKDTFSINENIKCGITAEKNIIQHKGLKPYTNKNHIGYIFLTNNDNPIKVPVGDRRFCGIECNNDICNNKEYFDALRTEMNDGNYDRAFYNYLLNVDIENYDFTNNRPVTNFYNDMKEMNIPPLALFLESIVMREETSYKVQSSVLFNQFTDYVSTFNFRTQPTLTKFILDIKKIDGIEQSRTSTARFINLDLVKVKDHLISVYNIDFTVNDFNDDDSVVSPLDQ